MTILSFLLLCFSLTVASYLPTLNEGIQPQISFDEYYSHDEINTFLDEVVSKNPSIAEVETIGKSYEGRDLKVLKLNSHSDSKPIILIDGGFHAREWITIEMVLYIINELTENVNNAQMLNGAQWHFLPVGNPDGYEFTRNPSGNRYWKKNRNLESSPTCPGVDLNRNFNFHWLEKDGGASDQPCDSTFAGPKAFSENETLAYQKYASSLQQIHLYLTIHSYGGDILYPWGYSSELPDDWESLDKLAHDANEANVAAGGQNWRIGSYKNTHYASAGNSADYMKGILKVPFVYTLQMPGWDFIIAPTEILEQVKPVFEMIRIFANQII